MKAGSQLDESRHIESIMLKSEGVHMFAPSLARSHVSLLLLGKTSAELGLHAPSRLRGAGSSGNGRAEENSSSVINKHNSSIS